MTDCEPLEYVLSDKQRFYPKLDQRIIDTITQQPKKRRRERYYYYYDILLFTNYLTMRCGTIQQKMYTY